MREEEGGKQLLMGLWEDAWRNIPVIVSGHLFSPRIRQISSECIKGDGDSERGRASTLQFTAGKVLMLRNGNFSW